MTHIIECARDQQQVSMYYVNLGTGLPAQGDARLYAPGLFQLATVGNTLATAGTSNNLGEFWVSYEIEFRKPRILPGNMADPLGSGLFDHFNFGQYNTNLITITPTAPFGTSTTRMLAPSSTSSLRGACSGGIVPATSQNFGAPGNPYNSGYAAFPIYDAQGNPIASLANTYYFPPSVSKGTYLCVYLASFATYVSGTWSQPFVTAYYNCASSTTITGANEFGFGKSTVNGAVMGETYINVTGPGAYFTFVPTSTYSSGVCSTATFSVSEVPSNII